MIRRPPRSTRTDTLSLHDALPIYTLQKLSYTGTIFVLLPLLIVSGLALSPGMDAAWPWLTQIFGGRQSARSVHFVTMAAMSGFVIVHLALVILAGPVNGVRSMRSEEHTSELQSLMRISYAVSCLKKKNKQK